MLIEVTNPHTATYPDPISFRAGEVLEVGRGDGEFPGWFWCRANSGREGWVHRTFFTEGASTATSIRPYSAMELTVAGGERGVALELLDGWVFVRLDRGDEGWLPESHLRRIEL